MKSGARVDDDLVHVAHFSHFVISTDVDSGVSFGSVGKFSKRYSHLEADLPKEITHRKKGKAELLSDEFRSARFAASQASGDGNDLFLHPSIKAFSSPSCEGGVSPIAVGA